MTFINTWLEWSRINLQEQVVPSKEIVQMGLALFQPLHYSPNWNSDSRYQFSFPSQYPPQAWNFDLESPPDWHFSESSIPITSWSHQYLLMTMMISGLILFIIKAEPIFMYESLVRNLGVWGHFNGFRHGWYDFFLYFS